MHFGTPAAVGAAVAMLPACTSSPTTTVSAPGEIRMDGGLFGSGHVTAPDGGETSGLDGDGESAGGPSIVPADSTGRGGTFGSGH